MMAKAVSFLSLLIRLFIACIFITACSPEKEQKIDTRSSTIDSLKSSLNQQLETLTELEKIIDDDYKTYLNENNIIELKVTNEELRTNEVEEYKRKLDELKQVRIKLKQDVEQLKVVNLNKDDEIKRLRELLEDTGKEAKKANILIVQLKKDIELLKEKNRILEQKLNEDTAIQQFGNNMEGIVK